MTDHKIFTNIEKHISLSDSDRSHLTSLLTVRTVHRKEPLLRQGKICKKIYFVESGSLRAYNLNEDGKDSTIMFAVQDWWITDMYSFIKQEPALLSIEALEDSKILELEYQVLEDLYVAIPKFERFFRILFQNAYIREQQRALQSISLRTEDRYREFVRKYPEMMEKVTQKQIASYLGVTPEFLSMIKRK